MSINFAQIHVSLAADGDNALLIIRGKMMESISWDGQIARHRQFLRLVDAFEAAERHDLRRTALMHFHSLQAMGAWTDEEGDWHDETRPIKPISDDDLVQ